MPYRASCPPYAPFARRDRMEPRAIRGATPGIDLALFAYVLFGLAFLLPLMAPIGAVLAYAGRARGGRIARSHFDRQIVLFWRSLLVLLAVGLLHAVVVGLGAITFGAGLVFLALPWGLGLVWAVWAAWSIGTGALSAWRRGPA